MLRMVHTNVVKTVAFIFSDGAYCRPVWFFDEGSGVRSDDIPKIWMGV